MQLKRYPVNRKKTNVTSNENDRPHDQKLAEATYQKSLISEYLCNHGINQFSHLCVWFNFAVSHRWLFRFFHTSKPNHKNTNRQRHHSLTHRGVEKLRQGRKLQIFDKKISTLVKILFLFISFLNWLFLVSNLVLWKKFFSTDWNLLRYCHFCHDALKRKKTE